MNLKITRPKDLVASGNGTIVIIDAIRATSTADVIFSASSLDMIWAVPTPDAVKSVENQDNVLVFSELSKETSEFNRVDNSPTVALNTDYKDVTPVLVTTNGTRAMHAALALSNHVVLASIRNAEAICRYLKAEKSTSIDIVPSGDFKSNTSHIEDDVCAQFIRSKLKNADFDLENQLQSIWDDDRIKRRLNKEPSLHRDIELCLQPDVSEVCIKVEETSNPLVLKLMRIP